MTRIGIISALWRRPALTEIFLIQLRRLSNLYNIPSVVAISEGDCRVLCDKWGVSSYVVVDNEPLGNKFNAAMERMGEGYNPDYVMVLGSDNFINDAYIQHLQHICNISRWDLISSTDLYFMSLDYERIKFGQLGYYNFGKRVGPGRCYSREVLEKVNWRPWTNAKETGLDRNSYFYTKDASPEMLERAYSIKDSGGFIIDIKTPGNINGIGNFGLKLYDREATLTSYLPEVISTKLVELSNNVIEGYNTHGINEDHFFIDS